MNTYYCYVLSSRNNRHLSVKATADLRHGIRFHRMRISKRLGRRHVYQKLVWVQTFAGLTAAVERERELNRWSPGQLAHLIRKSNPSLRAISVSGVVDRVRQRSQV